PVGKYGGHPRADAVRGSRQHEGPHDGRLDQPQDRQRHQHADQERNAHQLPVIRVLDRPGPGEFRFARGVQNAPIGTDAAFEEFPRLNDRLDDVVFHADGFGAADEGPQRHRLLERPRVAVFQIVTGAGPAELRDYDTLARKGIAQLLIDDQRLLDRLLVGKAFPIGQDMRGDEIDRRRQFRMLQPDVPDFTRCYRNIDRSLDALDELDQVFDLLFAAVDRLVSDHDAVDVAVALGEVDGRQHLAFVAVDVLVDPGADGDLEADFIGNRGHHFDAAGRRIEPDRAGQRRQLLHVGADLVGVGKV